MQRNGEKKIIDLKCSALHKRQIWKRKTGSNTRWTAESQKAERFVKDAGGKKNMKHKKNMTTKGRWRRERKIFGVDAEEYKETKCKLLLLFGLTEIQFHSKCDLGWRNIFKFVWIWITESAQLYHNLRRRNVVFDLESPRLTVPCPEQTYHGDNKMNLTPTVILKKTKRDMSWIQSIWF